MFRAVFEVGYWLFMIEYFVTGCPNNQTLITACSNVSLWCI